MEQKADKAWFDYCFEFKDGPYTAILEYKKALRREIEKEIQALPTGDLTDMECGALVSLKLVLTMIETVTPE